MFNKKLKTEIKELNKKISKLLDENHKLKTTMELTKATGEKYVSIDAGEGTMFIPELEKIRIDKELREAQLREGE